MLNRNSVDVAATDNGNPNQAASSGSSKKSMAFTFGKVIETRILQDVVSGFRVLKSTPPPPIPLCRLVRNPSVRATTGSSNNLAAHFEQYGYVKELGNFLVSVQKFGEPPLHVNDFDLEDWGPLWRSVNEEFEMELQSSHDWSHLSGKKFWVWDGNHRLQAWLAKIREGMHLIARA